MSGCVYIGPQAQQSVCTSFGGSGSTDPQQYTSLILLAHLAANAECTARRGGGGGGGGGKKPLSSAPQPRRARVKDQRQPTLLAVRGLLSKPNHSPNPNPNPNNPNINSNQVRGLLSCRSLALQPECSSQPMEVEFCDEPPGGAWRMCDTNGMPQFSNCAQLLS